MNVLSDFIHFNAAVVELVNRLKDSGNYIYRTFMYKEVSILRTRCV